MNLKKKNQNQIESFNNCKKRLKSIPRESPKLFKTSKPKFKKLKARKNFTTRSKHVTRSQKWHWMLDIISQNQTFIFLLPFKTIVIMAS